MSTLNASEESQKSWSNTEVGIYYLKIYFNFGYYVGYCPFKIVRNPITGFYTMKTSLFRKILSATLQLAFCINFLNFFRSTHLSFLLHFDKSPEYFHIANFASAALYLACIFITYFKNQPAISKIFARIGDPCQSEKYIPLNLRQKLIGICILVGYDFYSFFNTVLIAAETSNFDPLSTISHLSRISVPELKSNGWGCLIALVRIGVSIYTSFVSFYSDIFCLLLIFLYWQISNQFYSSIPYQAPLEVVKSFKIMKARVEIINKAIGYLLIGLCIATAPFIALGLGSLNHEIPTWTEVTRNLVITFCFLIGLTMSAYSHAKIAQFQKWLYDEKNYKEIPNSDLQVLLHEANSNKCGLTAAGGIFTVTFGLLGSILLLIMGYVVMIMQHQH